ncbi:unnamed protein product [Symbiodinium pilosum]|uniref:Macro domain-containing protein n=1 Tax=Symbiodinium pilosum TaxID=2952 RepID=A0A812YDT9_SYMPI|nr:unnamed protein product [Symbiodinium pilosum]
MPNMNPAVKDSPLDAPADAGAYQALLADKLKVALYGAALASASTVLVPGVGCGVFKNNPGDVGVALAEAIRGANDSLSEVVLVGVPDAMKSATAKALGRQL